MHGCIYEGTVRHHRFKNVYYPRFHSKAVLGHSIGSAEAYMHGLWSGDHLTTVLRNMALNRDSFERHKRSADFIKHYIGYVQMLFTKPMCRRESLLPGFNRILKVVVKEFNQ